MTTEEYVRSPEFETIGVAVCENGGDPQWFSGTKADTKKWLDSFEFDKHLVIAHNAVFDMAILNWQFDIRPKAIVDTLSMARAIHGTEVSVSLAKLAEHFQVIMVSHSPFILFQKGANFIDLVPNFAADNRKLIKKYLGSNKT